MDHKIIAHIRAIKKWRQKDLARELGVGQSAISHWEAGDFKLTRMHEFAIRHVAGEETYYIAAERALRGTEPTFRAYRGFL